MSHAKRLQPSQCYITVHPQTELSGVNLFYQNVSIDEK
jgi:hypothetical protein